jgi:hypothetical protein
MSNITVNTQTPRNPNLIDRLDSLYGNWKFKLFLYVLVFVASLICALIADLAFGISIQSATFICALVVALLLLGVPIIFASYRGNPQEYWTGKREVISFQITASAIQTMTMQPRPLAGATLTVALLWVTNTAQLDLRDISHPVEITGSSSKTACLEF